MEDVDDLIMPDPKDEVSTLLIKYISKERALEETLDQLKKRFQKKDIPIDDYLRLTRQISEKLFMTIQKRNSLSSLHRK